MSATANQLGAIKALVRMQDLVLQSNPEDLRQDGTLLAELAGARAGILAAQKALMAKSGFINLEFSLGRWNGDDVRGLEEPLLALVTRSCTSLLSSSFLLPHADEVLGVVSGFTRIR